MCTHAAVRPLIASPVAYTVIVAALFCIGRWPDRPGLLSRAYEDGAIFGPLAVSLALALRLWQSGQPASRVQARSIARVLALTALACLVYCLVYIAIGVFHALAGSA